MVYPRDEKLEKLSQEEIISNTKLVIQGLEALKNEHNSILHSLLETIKCLKKDEEANLVHEKSNLLRKSVEMIELGLGEAQVRPHPCDDVGSERITFRKHTYHKMHFKTKVSGKYGSDMSQIPKRVKA